MMERIVEFFLWEPLPVAFVGSHYLYYALPAIAVVAARLATGRLRRAEAALLAVYAVCMAAEFLQLGATGFRFFERGNKWGLARYFGVFAPLMWVWAAFALSRLWSRPGNVWVRTGCRVGIVAALGWLLVSENIGQMRTVYFERGIPDVVKAARGAARMIRNDYAGPRRQAVAKRTMHEYFTANRPVVFSSHSAAAWFLRGQSEGAERGKGLCPYPDDYLFIRAGVGYGGIEAVDARIYDYVGRVWGDGTEWRLFRRKTTPHR